jgi:hypothetical protein
VQPGVKINYKNGKNELDPDTMPEGAAADNSAADGQAADGQAADSTSTDGGTTAKSDESDGSGNGSGSDGGSTEYPPLEVPDGVTYVLNNNTMRFHRTDCKGARTIRDYNREWFYGTREEAIEAGYIPCGMCEP